MNIKRIITVFMTFCLLLSLAACRLAEEKESSGLDNSKSEQPESRQEENQASAVPQPRTVDWKLDLTRVPGGWKKPVILRLSIDTVVWENETLWDGTKLSEEAHHDLEKIFEECRNVWGDEMGHYDISEPRYAVNGFTNTQSEAYSPESTPAVIISPDTWTMNLTASCKVRGQVIVQGEVVFQTEENQWLPLDNWNFRGQDNWVLHREDDFLFVMTYADYAYARLFLGGEEDPFEKEWLDGGGYTGEYYYSGGPGGKPPEGSYYFEPIQGYVYKDAILYQYEAENSEDSEEMLQKAAIALGEQYLKELCSKEYEPGMEENYKIREFRDLTATRMINRRTGMGGTVVNITDESFLTWDWMSKYNDGTSYGVSGLANLKNMWIIRYSADVKGDGNYKIYGESEWKDTWVRVAVTSGQAGVMVKEGSTYYMILAPDIVTRAPI